MITDNQTKKGQKLPPLSERLKKLGLVRDWDFVLHLPFRYVDETSVTPIADLVVGEDSQIEGVVIANQENHFKKSFEAMVSDDTGTIKIRYLHYYPSIRETLALDKKVRLFGTVRAAWRGKGLEMIHPKTRALKADSTLPQTLTPVYSTTEGITQTWLQKRITRALLDVDISDLLSEQERQSLDLMGLRAAIEALHHPSPQATLSELQNRTAPAWKRLKFDELLAQQIMLRQSREIRNKTQGPAMQMPEDNQSLTKKFLNSLPFELTGAQKKVWKEIHESMASSRPMNRLIQGDVGSGKTVIAALAACLAIDNGFQAALMAPTEILAEQHFKKIIDWLTPFGVNIAWLSGKQKTKEKREALASVATDADIVVGTHALIQQSVKFKNLGLAIVDEQHRFGVNQRLSLRGEHASGLFPHLLMLSATPIPRTLAMSYLADVDVSVIDELPPGRKPVVTRLVSIARKDGLIEAIGTSINRGAQVYWVCPLIEESEKLDLTAATETFERIKEKLPSISVELMHSKVTSEEKTRIMDNFSSGRTKLLVSTTVIEVGVDVPNASIMVIEHAERFGLAQLHQLRGRIGRGGTQSYCFAMFGNQLSDTGKERLRTFKETNDGFEIAKKDLEMRGPGEFLGSRQSGVPLLRFADIQRDNELVEKARQLADSWVRNNDPRASEHANRWFETVGNYLDA